MFTSLQLIAPCVPVQIVAGIKSKPVVVMKFIQTCLGYVEDARTHVDCFFELHLELMHFYCNQILRKDASTVEIWFCDQCFRAVSAFCRI